MGLLSKASPIRGHHRHHSVSPLPKKLYRFIFLANEQWVRGQIMLEPRWPLSLPSPNGMLAGGWGGKEGMSGLGVLACGD